MVSYSETLFSVYVRRKINNIQIRVNKFAEASLYNNTSEISTLMEADITVLYNCYSYHQFSSGGETYKNKWKIRELKECNLVLGYLYHENNYLLKVKEYSLIKRSSL
jgi:hypothetical protein